MNTITKEIQQLQSKIIELEKQQKIQNKMKLLEECGISI